MSDAPKVVVCAKVTTPLRPRSVAGYQCTQCGEALQVGPMGLAAIKSGGFPLCNKCGLDIATKAALGPGLDIQLSQEVREWFYLKEREQ